MNMLAVSDEVGRVLFFLAGWIDFVHNNRVWCSCKMRLHASAFFSPQENLLGDAAFVPGSHLIPAYTNPLQNGSMSPEEPKFDTLLAKPRVKSRHCIGILKGRVLWLKNIRITIHEKMDLKKIVKLIRAAAILHNLLFDTPYEEEWMIFEDDL